MDKRCNKVNYFIEGLQGAGKSTFVQKLSEALKDYKVFWEGDYSPVELANTIFPNIVFADKCWVLLSGIKFMSSLLIAIGTANALDK